MRYLTVDEVLALHERIIETSGGSRGLRYSAGLESAIAQPQMTFGGVDLYATLVLKAAALGYSLIMNHPFVDGNKRVGHAAMEVMLMLNGKYRLLSMTKSALCWMSQAARCHAINLRAGSRRMW